MKTTKYFDRRKSEGERIVIHNKWIEAVMDNPESELIQADGRIRIWGQIPEMEGRYLRVIFLEDRKTVHNAFFDRRYKP